MYFNEENVFNKPSLLTLVTDFYILTGMDAMLGYDYFQFIKSAQVLHEDVKKFLDMFVKQFSAMIRDYTIMAVYGEARYTPFYATHFENGNHYFFFAVNNKERVADRGYYKNHINNSIYYTPESIEQFARTCFDPNIMDWCANYGGEKWYEIACSLSLPYTQNNPTLFIDYALDLQHNSGCYLDKGIVFDPSVGGLKDVLDYKRYHNVFQLIMKYGTYCDTYTRELCKRFAYIFDCHLYDAYKFYTHRGSLLMEDYRWGVPYEKIIAVFNKKIYSDDSWMKNNLSIFWLERYKPKPFGTKDASKLIVIPKMGEMLEPYLKKYGHEHYIDGLKWEW